MSADGQVTSFSPTRLQLARERLGLTKTRLAEKTQISTRTLGQYEDEDSGREPSSEHLVRLAEVLDVPQSFFLRSDIERIEQTAVSFRKLSRTKASSRDAALATATLAVEMFQTIGTKYALPQADLPTLDNLDPEHAAVAVRRQWKLGDRPISNLLHLLESKGVRIASIGPDDDIDAFCFTRDRTPYIMLNTAKSAARRRFDLAHELGHLVLHSEEPLTLPDSKRREQEANRFAGAFLMPRSAVLNQSMNSASVTRVLQAKKYWNVSALAMAHRLAELELLTPWQYRSLYLSLRDAGYARSEPNDAPAEHSLLVRKILFGAEGTPRYSVTALAADLDQTPKAIDDHIRDLTPLVVQ